MYTLNEIEMIIQESRKLVAKLDEVAADKCFQGIWPFLHVHGFVYTGPNWDRELEALREALKG